MVLWLIDAMWQSLQPLPEGYESSAFKVVMWAFVALLIAAGSAVGFAFKAARDDTKSMDVRHNETLRELGREFSTATQSISADDRAARKETAEALMFFGKVMAKQNAIQLVRYPTEIQNEINRMHPGEDKEK